MWDRGGNYDLDLSGEMDADGTTLKHARLLVKNYDSSGNILEDWDVELFDYPLYSGSFDQTMATCTKCELYYAFLKPPDWSQKIKINKMSAYSTMNGQHEVRKFTRIQSVSSSWVYLGRP